MKLLNLQKVNLAPQGGKGDQMRIVQEIKIWAYYDIIYAQSIQGNETHKIFWDFEKQTDLLISTRRPDQEWRKKN